VSTTSLSALTAKKLDLRANISLKQAHEILSARLIQWRSRRSTQPFGIMSLDFLTWFEYAPEYEPGFEELLRDLRASPEWKYVDWEVDIRLARSAE
jgi:hypothetical protein